MSKSMTKKQLIDALSQFKDDDEIRLTDMQYINEDFWCRNIWIEEVSSWCSGKEQQGPVLMINSNEMVRTSFEDKKSCRTCVNRDKLNTYACTVTDGEFRCKAWGGEEDLYVFINEGLISRPSPNEYCDECLKHNTQCNCQ